MKEIERQMLQALNEASEPLTLAQTGARMSSTFSRRRLASTQRKLEREGLIRVAAIHPDGVPLYEPDPRAEVQA